MVATPLASRVSRKLTRECAPPRVKELPREQVHLLLCLSSPLFFYLLALSFFLLSSPLTSPPCNPPYAPSGVRTLGFYLFSLITAGGHVGTFHSHSRGCSLYVHGVRSTSRSTGLSLPRASSPPSAVPYAPLPHRTASLGAPQVLQYVSTLLRRRKGAAGERRDSGRESREGAKTR